MQELCPLLQAAYRGLGFSSAHRGYLHAPVLLDLPGWSQQLMSQLPAVATLSCSPWERLLHEQPGGQRTQRTSRGQRQQLGESELHPCLWEGLHVGMVLWCHGVESLLLLPQNLRHLGSQMCGAAPLETAL